MDPKPGNIRRSETVEQDAYEQEIMKSQNVQHQPFESLRNDKEQPKSTLKDKMKGLYKNTIKPASQEAIADLKVLTAIPHVEMRATKALQDVNRYPEVAKVSEVRRGNDLSPGELHYLAARKRNARDRFAKYLGLKPEQVHPEDVPTVSFGGSGGGFRAMIGMLGYCDELKRTGMWDILTYVAGVSGSCWSLAAYYTFGNASTAAVIEHCKKRLHPHHPLSGDAIRAVLTAPGGADVTLGPLVQKRKSGLSTVAMDLYSVFTTGYVFLNTDPIEKPGASAKREVAGYQQSWFKWSEVSKYLVNGDEPMPLLTAIRHERPWKDWADKEHPFSEPDHSADQHANAKDAWFQWFEMSPYEIGCDELGAWVPTWGFGRPYEDGKSTMQLPEQSLALLLGLCTSAPAGPLTSYLATISRALPPGFLGDSIHNLASGVAKLWGKQGTEMFQNHHPLHACNEHNFMFHLSRVKEGQPRSPGLENSPRIHLIDSGMDNNCPTYVFLHPEREADVIINMDASSDVQKDTFDQRVNQIGSRRGLKFERRQKLKAGNDPKDPDRFSGMYAQVYDGTLQERPSTVVDSYGQTVTNPPAPTCHRECTMIYMPLLPNERAVPGFDPSTAKFSGSYNLVWTPEQVEMLVKVCRANFAEGESTVKEAMHEAWLKKKQRREHGGPGEPTHTMARIHEEMGHLSVRN